MTIDRAATAWTPHPGGPLRYRANSRFGADGLPPGAWFGRVSAALEAPDGSVVVFQRGPAIEPIVFLDRDGQLPALVGPGLRPAARHAPDARRHPVADRRRPASRAQDHARRRDPAWSSGRPTSRARTSGRSTSRPTSRSRPTARSTSPTATATAGSSSSTPTAPTAGRGACPGTAPGEFDTPHSVAVAPDGSIWVSDRGNLRIQRFEPDGRYIDAWTHLGRDPVHRVLRGRAVDHQPPLDRRAARLGQPRRPADEGRPGERRRPRLDPAGRPLLPPRAVR